MDLPESASRAKTQILNKLFTNRISVESMTITHVGIEVARAYTLGQHALDQIHDEHSM
ncbi:ORFL236C [Human betaherpesvirus 5]|nr:ORFL236C [Human betaherpesvirus 5]QHX40604.1 ORFL236C [Human betaherpesvirus 5]